MDSASTLNLPYIPGSLSDFPKISSRKELLVLLERDKELIMKLHKLAEELGGRKTTQKYADELNEVVQEALTTYKLKDITTSKVIQEETKG